MTRLFAFLFLFLSALPGVATARTETLVLRNGVKLAIHESPCNRRLPHSCYDQAIGSVTRLYPEHEVLAGRRFGTMGATEYSLLCYKRVSASGTVEIGGVFVVGRASWRFESRVAVDLFGDSLVLILEAISKPPSSKAMEGDG